MEDELEREKDVIHFYQMQNKKMSAQQAIHETRTLRCWKEAQRAHVKLEEFMGTYEESSDEEGQTRRRPRTMGLRKALAKQREEESAQAGQLSLQELLALEIEHDRESWLERANLHLEAKLEKANKDLDLQRKMAKNYAQRDQFARQELKRAKIEIQALKEEKDQSSLGILAQASIQVSQDP